MDLLKRQKSKNTKKQKKMDLKGKNQKILKKQKNESKRQK